MNPIPASLSVRTLKRAALLMLLLTASGMERAVGQTTSGTLIGQVLGVSGGGLGDVKVVAVNERNSNTRAVLTDQQGIYHFYFLTPGLYTINASHDGYADGSVTHFEIPLNVTTPLRPPDITLSPLSAPAPTPSTTGATPSGGAERGRDITTTDPTRRGNFAELQLESLPLGGLTDMRTFDELAFLLPGVAPPPYTPGVRGPGVGFGIGTAGEFSVNGMRARSNNFTVDGSDNNDPDVGVRRQGFVALVPQSIESINEFEMSTLLWDTELGRNFGSQVNAVSKDGGKDYHGAIYGFFTDSALNARNFFDYTDGPVTHKDPFTRSQTGHVFGGPISSTTQFFESFEEIIVSNSVEQHFATPTLSERRFLGLPRFAVLRPFLAAPPSEFFSTDLGATPLGRNILSFYPLPNDPGGPYGPNTFTQSQSADGQGSIFSAKIVHQFAQKSTLAGRYNFTNDDKFLPAINRAINSATKALTRTQDLSLIMDSQLGSGFFNNTRFSYGRTRLNFTDVAGSPLLFRSSSNVVVGLPGGGTQTFPSDTFPLGEVLIQPFSPVGVDVFTFPQARVNNTFQYADSISRAFGSHSIKFGADIRRVQLNSLLDRNFRPQVVYGNAILTTGTLNGASVSSPASFTAASSQLLSGIQLATLGLPSSIFQSITAGTPDSTIGLRFTEYNFFFNDNWRARKNFTIDYGLRYEYNTVPHEVNNRIEDAITLKNLPSPGGSPADTPERTKAFNDAVAAYRAILDGRTGIYNPDHKDFAPYIGFAWDPWSDGRTSIRGGYGIYYDAILGAVVTQSRNVFPNEIPVNVEPAFTNFDVFILNTPQTLAIPAQSAGGGLVSIPLIKPGTLNQLGGTPADFVALIGALFIQNQNGGGLAFTLPDKRLRTPYDQQWHLTVEREVTQDFSLSAAYVGSKGARLTRLTTPNLGPNVTPSILLATKFTNFPAGFTSPPLVLADCSFQVNGKCSVEPNRPTPFLGAYQIFENSATSNYHALEVGATKRYSHGYAVTVAYTLSHAMDDVSDVFPIAGAPVLPQDSFNLRLERASANFDIRHRLAASVVWDLPFYQDSNKGAARWLGGWQLSGFFQANSGQPFTLLIPFDANFDGNLTDRPATDNGLIFTDGHNRQRVSIAPGHTLDSFVVLGQDGAVGRNTARGDSFVNLDLALIKAFRLSERQKLNFRAEFFNALNRANFGLPIGILGAPGFGSAVDTASPARIVQFALKYSF